MRGPASAAVRVFRELYPKSEPNDPESLEEYGEYFLVPELRVELDLFYGALDKNDGLQRRARRPGIDYNDQGWRLRMSKWYYHAELFQIFEKLRLRSWEIDDVCVWWGTKAEVAVFENLHPGLVIGDDIWDGIARAAPVGPPEAIFHDPAERTPRAVPRKRSSRLRRLMQRPKAVRSWRDLSRSASPAGGVPLEGIYEQNTSQREPSSPGSDDSLIEYSVGRTLNPQFQPASHGHAFEEWYKDEQDNGHSSGATSSSRGYTSSYQQPFQVSTNTISYSATPHHSMAMPSYTERMLSANQRPIPGIPLAVTTSSSSIPRSSQARQTSLGRYQSQRAHQYRAIRPRPMRNPSRG